MPLSEFALEKLTAKGLDIELFREEGGGFELPPRNPFKGGGRCIASPTCCGAVEVGGLRSSNESIMRVIYKARQMGRNNVLYYGIEQDDWNEYGFDPDELLKYGFKRIGEFYNENSGNAVGIYQLEIA